MKFKDYYCKECGKKMEQKVYEIIRFDELTGKKKIYYDVYYRCKKSGWFSLHDWGESVFDNTGYEKLSCFSWDDFYEVALDNFRMDKNNL